jgi:hypothetical protein
MAIMTWAEAIKLSPTNLEAAIHYGAVQEDPIFSRLPFEWWPGGQSVTWTQTTTLPTTAWRLVTDAMSGSAPTRTQWVQTLREAYTQMEVPPLHEGSISNVINQRAANITDMSRSIGLAVRNTIIAGEENTVAIGATATTKGVDGAKFGPGWAAGLVYLHFDDTADTIAISSDGTTYGTAVSTAGPIDLHQVALYDGVAGKTHQYCYLTLDGSDIEGGGDFTTVDAATGITLTTAKKPAGLIQWPYPTQRIWGTLTTTPTAAGDAASLAQLDYGLDMVPGCNLIVTTKRTRRSLKALLAGSADTVTHWMGKALARPMLGYEGIPIWVSDQLPITETAGVGGTATTCGSIYFVRVDAYDGFSTYYWNEGGASVSVNDDGVETPVGLPIYYRDLGEISTTLSDSYLRMTGHFCPVLKNTQALFEVHGINN